MKAEEKSIIKSFIPPLLFVALLWLVKGLEIRYSLDLHTFGIFPRDVSFLRSILTMPFIHDDFKHLFSNTLPLVILGAMLIYFYKEVSLKVFLLIWVLHATWLWIGGRSAWHIGASGIVYGLASFLLFSGILRKDTRLMALSMLVIFLYGSMIWGMFPLFHGMSWEAHLFGAMAGLLLAFVYRKEGPQRKVYEWENEEAEEFHAPFTVISSTGDLTIPDEGQEETPEQERSEGKLE